MTAVEVRAPERMPTQAAVNGHVRDRYINATMTREARIAWRLEHLDEWRRDLESLAYFDPDCPYDVAHEYDHDWSTDPDYGDEGIGFSEFEEDGCADRQRRPTERPAGAYARYGPQPDWLSRFGQSDLRLRATTG